MIGNNSYGDTIVGGDSVITLLINDKMSFYRYAVPSGDVSFYLEFKAYDERKNYYQTQKQTDGGVWYSNNKSTNKDKIISLSLKNIDLDTYYRFKEFVDSVAEGITNSFYFRGVAFIVTIVRFLDCDKITYTPASPGGYDISGITLVEQIT